jgi:hypothetical protein
MPFIKYDRFGNDRFGYINSETFEIVITDQYERAGNFYGEYAVVKKRFGKPFIINKNNKKILGGFDNVVFYNTEDDKMVFALTETYGKYQVWWASGEYGSFGFPYAEPSSITYRFYNLTTGKLVAKKRTYWMGRAITSITDISTSHRPKIYFFNNYFIWIYKGFSRDEDYEAVYEIQNDGSVKKCTMTVEEFISQIVLEYELQKNERDYNYSIGKHYSWIEYFNPLDIDKLLDQVPDNMKIVVDEHKNNKPFLSIKLIDNITHPLKDKFLYEVHLNKHKYKGIYDASENIWVIPPIKNTFMYFYFIEGTDWIACTDRPYHDWSADFFNIKTRKKYKYQYRLQYDSMIYFGYFEAPYTKLEEPIVEDF